MKRNLSIDIIRVAACIMVFGVHLGQHVVIPGKLGTFFEKGSTGVIFFFIISGFLACFSLERDFRNYNSRKAVLVFWIKRLVRIVPLYYCLLLFYFVFFSIRREVPVDESGLYWLRYIFFINLWIPTRVEFWSNLGALWSVSVFVLFYLIAPLVYKLKNHYYYMLGLTLAFYGVLKLIDMKDLGRVPIKYLFYFFVGVLIYAALLNHREYRLFYVSFGIVLFCFMAESGMNIVPTLLMVLAIVGGAKLESPGIDESVISKTLMFLSTVSFAVYLVHPAVIVVLDTLGIRNGIVYTIALICISLGVAIPLHFLVEKRLGEYIKGCLLRLVKAENN